MKVGVGRRPIHMLTSWIRRQPPKVKAFLAVVAGMAALVLIRMIVKDHDNLFVASEAVHAIGVCVLIFKLSMDSTCADEKLIAQQTLWVIYMIRFKLRATYMEAKDNLSIYYVVIPCAVLAVFVHPTTSHHVVNRIAWAFCGYMEAVSVLPQLRVMQNAKIVEPFTAHYVFALGGARFLSCAHWVLQVLDTRGGYLTSLGSGLWISAALLSENVQTFILADFCYYYVKSVFGGLLVLRLPS